MDAQTALNNISEQLGNLSGTRADHAQLLEWVKVLQNLVDKTLASVKAKENPSGSK